MEFLNRTILLASKSPRRRQLLEESGFTFELVNVNVLEEYDDNILPADVPVYLATKKAKAALHYLQANQIILAADSVVIRNNKVYEKPLDRADAERMLRELSDGIHEVITGVCLISPQEERSFSGRSKVYMQPISQTEINYYIDHFQPYDKAGGYGIQEWIGHCKVQKIEGSYTNIMGLPMELVYEELRKMRV